MCGKFTHRGPAGPSVFLEVLAFPLPLTQRKRASVCTNTAVVCVCGWAGTVGLGIHTINVQSKQHYFCKGQYSSVCLWYQCPLKSRPILLSFVL